MLVFDKNTDVLLNEQHILTCYLQYEHGDIYTGNDF